MSGGGITGVPTGVSTGVSVITGGTRNGDSPFVFGAVLGGASPFPLVITPGGAMTLVGVPTVVVVPTVRPVPIAVPIAILWGTPTRSGLVCVAGGALGRVGTLWG